MIYGMAGAMALAFIVALRAMPAGKAEQVVEEGGEERTAGIAPPAPAPARGVG